jgi:hypothetical protein
VFGGPFSNGACQFPLFSPFSQRACNELKLIRSFAVGRPGSLAWASARSEVVMQFASPPTA